MMDLVIVILVGMVFICLGLRLLRMIKLDMTVGEGLAFAYVLGAGVAGLVILGIGMLGFLRYRMAYGAVLLALVACQQDLRRVLWRAWQGARGCLSAKRPRLARLAWMVLVCNIAVDVFASFAPPTGTDVLSARLAIPKAYVDASSIIYLPSNLHANLPGNVEMMYTLCALLGSRVAPQLLHLSFGLCLLLGIYCLAVGRFSPSVAALSCLLFYSLTDVVAQFGKAYSDLAVGAFSLFAFVAWLRWWERGERRALILAGILGGLAAGAKLNALGVLATLTLTAVVATWQVRREPVRQGLTNGLRVLLPGLAFFSPWLIKNLLLTGNPLYPLFAELLGGRGITPIESSMFFDHAMRNSAIERHLISLLALPWKITMLGQYTSGTLGPLFLTALVFVPWLRPWPALLRPIGWFALPFVFLWYWGSPFVRFAFVLLALLSIVAIWALGELSRRSKHTRALCVASASLWFTVATGNNVRVHEDTFAVELGLESREDYLKQVLPARDGFYYFEDLEWMNAHLPRDAKVLSWTWSNYYLERPWIFLGRLHAYADTTAVDSPQAFLKLMRVLGVSHLFVVDGLEDSRYRPVPRANDFVRELAARGGLQEIWRRSGVHVYRLDEQWDGGSTCARGSESPGDDRRRQAMQPVWVGVP